MIRIAGIKVILSLTWAIAFCLFFGAGTQAAVLEDFRMGLKEKRTRLVYQLDETAVYEIDYNESSVTLRFESLSISETAKEKLRDVKGGILGAVDYLTHDNTVVFNLHVSEPFLLRYFDLVKPARLVVDLYSNEQPAIAEAAPTEQEMTEEPVADVTEEEPPQVEEEVSYTEEDIAAKVSEETSEPLQEEPTPRSKAQTPQRPIVVEDNLSILYIILPIVIILLLVIGFISLRRASRRTTFHDEARAPEEWDYDGGKFRDLVDTQELNKIRDEIREETEEEEATAEEGVEEIPTETEPVESYEEELSEVLSDEPESVVERAEDIDISPAPITPKSESEEEDIDDITDEKEDSTEPKEEDIVSEPRRRVMHRVVDEGEAQLNFEEGYLIWPIHILESDRPGRILVVDDEEEIVSALDQFLQRENFDVLGVTDSEEAVEKYWEYHPDLVITDVIMPKLSGVELVKKINEKNGGLNKVIFLSGRTERDDVSTAFPAELDEGKYEFFRKPLSLVQISGRLRDYFTGAQEVLRLNLLEAEELEKQLQHLIPQQLVTLQKFLWDRIFEVSAEMLGRRIEPYYITDRMEPPVNYMRRVGCQEREDYCIANICFGSNPTCAADKIRGELEVMRQIISEFRNEYVDRVSRGIGEEAIKQPARARKKVTPKKKPKAEIEKDKATPPPRKTLRKLVTPRKR